MGGDPKGFFFWRGGEGRGGMGEREKEGRGSKKPFQLQDEIFNILKNPHLFLLEGTSWKSYPRSLGVIRGGGGGYIGLEKKKRGAGDIYIQS